jgi:hypothetical protein
MAALDGTEPLSPSGAARPQEGRGSWGRYAHHNAKEAPTADWQSEIPGRLSHTSTPRKRDGHSLVQRRRLNN